MNDFDGHPPKCLNNIPIKQQSARNQAFLFAQNPTSSHKFEIFGDEYEAYNEPFDKNIRKQY